MKRPLGLAKAKASKGDGSASKKQKVSDDIASEESPQSLAEDWEDLQELFGRAISTFLKGQLSDCAFSTWIREFTTRY